MGLGCGAERAGSTGKGWGTPGGPPKPLGSLGPTIPQGRHWAEPVWGGVGAE